MRTLRSTIWIGPIIAGTLLYLLVCATPSFAHPPVVKSSTVQDLQSAYNMESNVHARYRAFAERADRDGYGEVASLFRATARSEEILMRNHAEVLRTLGAEPRSTVRMPVVLSTRKNLESAAAQAGGGERDMMYSMFIVEARGEGSEDAVRSFRFAVSAVAQHVTLFTDAIRDLQMMRGRSRVYYVCGTCGATSEVPGGDMCSVCMSHSDTYERIS